MGFFDKFQNHDKPVPAEKTAAPDSTPETEIAPTLDRAELLSIVAEKCPGAEVQGNSLWYPKQQLRLFLQFGEMFHANGLYNVQLLFIAQHSWFDEDFVESCAGIGRTPDEAMTRGTENFCAAVFTSLLAAFGCTCDNWVTADVMGRKCTFRLPCVRANFHMGGGEGTDLWEIVKDEIPLYLGTKRCYWVKLFSSSMNGIPNCEARINGIVYPDLTTLLEKDVIDRNRNLPGFASDKLFLLFIQKEETFQPCPFRKQDVGEMAFHAIRILQNVKSEQEAERANILIRQLAPTAALGAELVSFLPEIYAQQVVQFRDNDTLMPVINRGKPEVSLKKSQVRSYGYIEDAVEQFLRKQQPTPEESALVLAFSAKFHALSEAIEKGAEIENLRLSQLVYFVDENYQPW